MPYSENRLPKTAEEAEQFAEKRWRSWTVWWRWLYLKGYTKKCQESRGSESREDMRQPPRVGYEPAPALKKQEINRLNAYGIHPMRTWQQRSQLCSLISPSQHCSCLQISGTHLTFSSLCTSDPDNRASEKSSVIPPLWINDYIHQDRREHKKSWKEMGKQRSPFSLYSHEELINHAQLKKRPTSLAPLSVNFFLLLFYYLLLVRSMVSGHSSRLDPITLSKCSHLLMPIYWSLWQLG